MIRFKGLTRNGEAKIQRMIRVAVSAAKESLKHNVETSMLSTVARRAPSLNEEKNIIIKDSGGLGEHYIEAGADTFIDADRIPLKKAIIEDHVDIEGEDIIWARTGHKQEINEKTKFYYMRRKRAGGIQVSYPYNFQYVETVENGGMWRVVPRGDWPLMPEYGITIDEMTKTVAAYGMYSRGLKDQVTLKRMRANINKFIKGEVRLKVK